MRSAYLSIHTRRKLDVGQSVRNGNFHEGRAVLANSRSSHCHTASNWAGLACKGLAVAFAWLGLAPAAELDGGETLSFNRDVRPILSNHCFACHGPDEAHRGADLRLDQAEAAHEYAIVPGNADESEIIARILETDEDLRMPPADIGKRLTEDEIQILRRWVDAGAPYEAYWAYVPPKPVSIPPGAASGVNAIDSLVRRDLDRQRHHAAELATRRNQLRRLSLDLLGLPPSPEQVDQFLKDDQPDAYLRRVDELLASPRFGERFAEYWLDLVRFADTVGYHGDQIHNIAPYRDWVIDSINQNKSLDQFSREQLAGDLLDDPTTDQLIASGYNRLLQTTHEGGLQPKEYRAIYAADRVRNVSEVWMAATMGCCQCHDHKYDPYTALDFYSMAAFFADVDDEAHFKNGSNALPTRREPEIDVLSATDRMRLESIDRAIAEAKEQGDTAVAEMLREQREEIDGRRVRTMITKAMQSPRETRFLPRGNWLDESGDVVAPAVPAFLGDIHRFAKLAPDARANRLHLANWLFDCEEGIGRLTARVFANRLWYLYSGQGISPSLADFGGQGQPPRHSALLDHLAGVLIDSDWDIKATVRIIVTSETYRRQVAAASELHNKTSQSELSSLVGAVQSGHRLPAETVRDSLLFISGLLDDQVGGQSAKPFQPAGYYRHLNFPRRTYQHDSGAMQWRRGVYTHWQRQFVHPMMKALDAPSREECTAQRSRSNTPLESLALLNDPTFVIAAQAFAARVLRETESSAGAATETQDRIHHAFRLALSRKADPIELQTLLDLFDAEHKRYQTDAAAADGLLSLADATPIAWPTESGMAERAAWTSACRVIFNLHETLYRP
ncbi:PSD1 and planctomycete cytochrome C domain-containing protein [Roseiconus lacunae]|uniref:DUF1553 domain-containing protein n=1 Tax=Roseiconus lacunae TaxID=2605694 RepID=UPI003085E6DE|nr:PSD1 and planctomycete cytochrome C domain-containing protein [Stieleria sp. HD01]